jgi:hypothetical protein
MVRARTGPFEWRRERYRAETVLPVNVGRGVTVQNFLDARSRAVGFNEDSALAIEWNVERFQ